MSIRKVRCHADLGDPRTTCKQLIHPIYQPFCDLHWKKLPDELKERVITSYKKGLGSECDATRRWYFSTEMATYWIWAIELHRGSEREFINQLKKADDELRRQFSGSKFKPILLHTYRHLGEDDPKITFKV